LLLAEPAHLDPDDSLAQMILHEICHSLVQGEASFQERDWGLDNESERDVPREQACLRLQAALAGAFGLRQVLAPTTDYRAFYDALPDDPFFPRWDPTTVLAILGRRRAEEPPWAPHLFEALHATRAVAEQAARFADAESREKPESGGYGDLWMVAATAPLPHPSGLVAASISSAERACGTCAWRFGAASQCRQAGVRVKPEWPGCERWEPPLDCQECGACCRAAYDCVQVSVRDPVRKKHPELIVLRGPFLEVRRAGDRCAALSGGPGFTEEPKLVPYTCAIYADRPKSCRDFENAGAHCLTARRKVGLSL